MSANFCQTVLRQLGKLLYNDHFSDYCLNLITLQDFSQDVYASGLSCIIKKRKRKKKRKEKENFFLIFFFFFGFCFCFWEGEMLVTLKRDIASSKHGIKLENADALKG